MDLYVGFCSWSCKATPVFSRVCFRRSSLEALSLRGLLRAELGADELVQRVVRRVPRRAVAHERLAGPEEVLLSREHLDRDWPSEQSPLECSARIHSDSEDLVGLAALSVSPRYHPAL